MVNSNDDASSAAVERFCVEIIFLPDNACCYSFL
jgi:hypothetical protein